MNLLASIILDENRKIPYDLVTQKLNDWYTLIKNDQVEQADCYTINCLKWRGFVTSDKLSLY
ncbi:hypothetical protein FA037_12310 [Bacillus amyloliquefaciens]|nr:MULTISPECIES: hypothetical protein [Bacillus amyloliquefaciens group]MBU8887291.1 hypothetical protein [Bacillus sp. FJAT-27001]CDG28466.1 protein of unknown function [Bacillus velezensis UCMB5033]MBU5240413.1 hypothetical protein [Bacillus velezensis]MBY0195006.1 hypothetical protein [Bacillus velezensis]NYZ55289.1 hypothetical protein [Bacillus amyloliquefaciens]